MKKFFILTILILFLTPQSFADTSFKTFTPTQSRNNNHYNHNRHFNNNHYNGYRNPKYDNSYNKKFKKWKRHNKQDKYNNLNPYNSSYFYDYNPYYNNYYPKRTFLNSIKDFFSDGQVTGYTPSYNSSFDNIPYGYQSGIYDPNGNFIQNDYGFQSGATVKILD